MPNGARIVLDNVFYHIMTRGNHKLAIFNEVRDFDEYLIRLKRYKYKYKFKLYGYCLMPNHIHIVGEIADKKHLAKFMHGLNRSYTAYFNDKYGKVGHLWQGRFVSKIIVKDRYAIDCINYVELNPIRARMANAPHEYVWSSYKERNLNMDASEGLLDKLIL